jgi:succinate dehydrogenase/fumarate reductase flavoprotein subunit
MPAVTTAAEMLTYAAERGTAWMFLARIGVMLHRHEVRQFNPTAKTRIGESGS